MVNKEALDGVIQFVNNSPDYSFRKFLGENNLLSGYKERGNDFWVCCPFHLDENASCSFNDITHGFHCFSCGRSGNYIKFVSMYKSEKLGNKTNFYSEAESLLRGDPVMQAALGIRTIYKQEPDIRSYIKLPHLKVAGTSDYDLYLPNTYVGLSTLMINRGCTLQEIKKMIFLMQHDLPIVEIYREIFGSDSISVKRANAVSVFSETSSSDTGSGNGVPHTAKSFDLDEILSTEE